MMNAVTRNLELAKQTGASGRLTLASYTPNVLRYLTQKGTVHFMHGWQWNTHALAEWK